MLRLSSQKIHTLYILKVLFLLDTEHRKWYNLLCKSMVICLTTNTKPREIVCRGVDSMANRVFQEAIHKMEGVIERTVGVVNNNCMIVACSNLNLIGEMAEGIEKSALTQEKCFVNGKYTYAPFGVHTTNPYLLFIEGTDEESEKYVNLLSLGFSSLKEFYEEKYDANNFIKNVLLDNILPGDIYQKSRELNFDKEASRVVLLVRILNPGEFSVFDVLQTIFPDRGQDYVISINETDFAIVKQVKEDIDSKSLEQLGRSIVDTLGGEFFTTVSVGIGTVTVGVRGLANSFKEAQTALEVGKIFDVEKNVVSYDRLGIARLIYQIPNTVCDMFMKEIFKMDTIESLDSETLFTIHEFFDNNLNVSETSRKLFVHRNTLVYRLEKIKRLTGLDLREFDDAIVFKVALMVDKYLTSKNEEKK